MSVPLLPGDPVPGFVAPSDGNPRYSLQATGGRWVLLGVFDSAGRPGVAEALAELAARAPGLLDGHSRAALLISADAGDRAAARIPQLIPQYRAIWDVNGAIGHALGDGWLLLDPTDRKSVV